MLKLIYSAAIAISLVAIPMSGQAQESKAKSETSKSTAKSKTTTTTTAPAAKREPTPGQLAARASETMRGRVVGSQGGRQDQGHDVAEILERLQQAAQGKKHLAEGLSKPR